MERMILKSRSTTALTAVLLVVTLALPVIALPALAQPISNPHTDPINLTPQVREAHEHFYNLDYDGALTRFEAIQKANPQSVIATGYVLMVLIFRELYQIGRAHV